MKKIFVYSALVILGLGLASAAFLIVTSLLKDDPSKLSSSNNPYSAKTAVVIKVKFFTPKGQIKQRMVLACQGQKPLPATKGFNLDIPSQARVACKQINKIPSGDYTCQALSGAGRQIASGQIAGIVEGRKLKAEFSFDASKKCSRSQGFWNRFQKLWNLSGPGDKKEVAKAALTLKKSQQRNKQLAKKNKQQRKAMKTKIRNYDKQNKKFLAPTK